jgi:putative sporulation protein YyaC
MTPPNYKPAIKENKIFTINTRELKTSYQFVATLQKLLGEIKEDFTQLIILCIGSDRSTGDSLGPLVGSSLRKLGTDKVVIMGTLSEPVHALNLEKTMECISQDFRFPAIIAIDASLGNKNEVGCLKIGKGPLRPGAAVQKKLPPVGDIFITGIVNTGGFMEFMVLQSTRLSIVLSLANYIAWGIFKTLSQTKWLPVNQRLR